MRIRYTVTLDDLIALYKHRIRQEFRVGRRLWPFARWVVPIVLLVPCLAWMAVSWQTAPNVLLLITVVVVTLMSTAWMFFAWDFDRFMLRSVARHVRRLFGTGQLHGMIGPQELELADDGLIHRNSVIESHTQFDGLRSVATEGAYTFVISNLFAPHVIPHAAVTEGDPVAFTDALRERVWLEAWD